METKPCRRVKTLQLFKKNPVNCVGRKGDVFLANYMTAHFIAPNTSPNIRYAVYFRVSRHGIRRKLPNGKHDPSSMLAPWLYWFDNNKDNNVDNRVKYSSNGGKSGRSKDAEGEIPEHLMPSEEELQLMRFYEQNSNNDHTIPKSLQRLSSQEDPARSGNRNYDQKYGDSTQREGTGGGPKDEGGNGIVNAARNGCKWQNFR